MHTQHPFDLIENVDEDHIAGLRAMGQRITELTAEEFEEVKKLPAEDRRRWLRKNRNRNKPCPCGSGVKFKKCCW